MSTPDGPLAAAVRTAAPGNDTPAPASPTKLAITPPEPLKLVPAAAAAAAEAASASSSNAANAAVMSSSSSFPAAVVKAR